MVYIDHILRNAAPSTRREWHRDLVDQGQRTLCFANSKNKLLLITITPCSSMKLVFLSDPNTSFVYTLKKARKHKHVNEGGCTTTEGQTNKCHFDHHMSPDKFPFLFHVTCLMKFCLSSGNAIFFWLMKHISRVDHRF
jgi:hypothetical protein